jgi:hypothetical protein
MTIKIKNTLLLAFFLQLAFLVFGQSDKIKLPNYDDKYSRYVGQLEAGNLDIDYTDFRNSFLESKQIDNKGTNYDELKKQVIIAIKNKNYQDVIQLTKSMLGIDYTSMFAHKYLQQTYKITGDTANQHKYHDIEFGLLNSIIKSGDGKSCKTGWHVTQIEEEYFILSMIGAKLQEQSISSEGNNTCEKMIVKTENGDTQTYFFEANKIFERERKLFGK